MPRAWLAFLDEQARSGATAAERERAALERAVLLDEVLDRTDEAQEAYQQLSHSAQDPEIRSEAGRRFESTLERCGDWDTLRQHLEQALEDGTPEQRVQRHERLARLCGDRLGDEAAEIHHLEQIVALDASRTDIWRALSEHYDHEDRVDAAIDAMAHELASNPDASRALTLHARLAELTLHARRDEARAAWHYERVFELNPAHAAAARFLIERYESDRRPEDVIRVLESRLAALDSVTEGARASESQAHRTALRVHIAEVRARQLDDLEGAISALEVALGEAGPSRRSPNLSRRVTSSRTTTSI
jgi:tetratricopeptide (TPR) repeat protein